MARSKQPKAKPGRKVKLKRKSYPLDLKTTVIAWKKVDKMKTSEIQKRLKDLYNLDVADSTLSTWWNPKNLAKVGNMSSDRRNVKDKRINPTQRPDVLVDMERILSRKVIAINLTGLPYTREIVQILAIHIFHKLIGYNLYNAQGHRKNPNQDIDEEIIQSVEQTRLATQYLSKSR